METTLKRANTYMQVFQVSNCQFASLLFRQRKCGIMYVSQNDSYREHQRATLKTRQHCFTRRNFFPQSSFYTHHTRFW